MRLIQITLFFIYLLSSSCNYLAPEKKSPLWVKQIKKSVVNLEKKFNGEFGVYIKDLSTQAEFSHNGSQFWYLSSTIKIPVAIALLKLVDQKKLKLSEKVTVTKADYRDGAGPVNWIKPGEQVSYRYLFIQMLKRSDNAATDLIIKRVGIDSVNKLVSKYTDNKKFGPITTLLDVRRIAYSEFHPKARTLSNMAYFSIKKQKNYNKKVSELAKQLKISRKKLKLQNYTKGFDRYYAKRWNSAPLTSYATILEQLVSNKILSATSTKLLLNTLGKILTGKKRISAGLPKKTHFSHKTGTQHKQACDVGIANDKSKNKPKLLILVCTRKWKKLSDAENIMSQIGKMVSRANLLN